MADRGLTVDYNTARKLVTGVVAWRKERIGKGFAEDKVGKPIVNTDFIIAISKGKAVARLLETATSVKMEKVQKENKTASDQVIASSTTEKAVTEAIVPPETTPFVSIAAHMIASAPADASVPVTEKSEPVKQPVIHSRQSRSYGRR